MDEIIVAKSKTEIGLLKSPTGIKGLDDLTFGGLPTGRPTLICGNAGCGKTVLSMEFLVNGAVQYNEPGVFMSFEESDNELISNFSSLGFKLEKLMREKKISLEYVYIERSEIEETGEYDLDGLFIRLESAIDSIGAKRVVLDTLEALFSGFKNENILRAELRRLFRWLKNKGITAIITGERGETMGTKFGLEEYVADCVIMLDHRVTDQIATRRLKIVKYRGSLHGTNEYPFLIDAGGVSVLPITSMGLNYQVSSDRLSSGIQSLDKMLDNKGFFKSSAILISGTAGTGKTNITAHFVNSACKNGIRCLFFAFEESPNQLLRNLDSIDIRLQPWIDSGLLKFIANRPSHFGLEMHLVNMHKEINDFNPQVVVIDSITNLISSGLLLDTKIMLTRLLDFIKMKQITLMITDLMPDSSANNTEIGISTLSDAWISLRNSQRNNEMVRTINIIKARGMNHSNQVMEFTITGNGIQIN